MKDIFQTRHKLKFLSEKVKVHRKKIKTGLAVLSVVLFLVNALLAFDNLQKQMPILGLKLNVAPVSFLNHTQLQQVVRDEIRAQSGKSLKFSYGGQIFEIRKDAIGAKVDPRIATDNLLNYGRNGNFVSNLSSQLLALVGFRQIGLSGTISQSLLTVKILEIQTQVDNVAKPIMPDFTGDISKTLPAQDGIKVNTNKLTVLVADNIFNPPQDPLPLPVMKTFTTHTETELGPIRQLATNLAKQPISIITAGQVFTLSVDDIKNLLTETERPDNSDPKKLKLELRLDDKKLNQKLGDFAEKVESITRAEFDNHDASNAIYAQFYSGKRKLVEIPSGIRADRKVLADTTGPRVAYLTFDDGPNSIYHPMILDILKAYNVKATFFLVGQNSLRDADVTRRTYAEGHKVGNHSLTHPFLPNLSNANILKEISSTDDILKTFDGNLPIDYFRPPYGGVNLAVKQDVDNLHLKMFLWDVDPRDWSEPSTEELVRRVVTNTFPGADILLHSNHLVTVKALPKIIETLKAQGYSFQTL